MKDTDMIIVANLGMRISAGDYYSFSHTNLRKDVFAGGTNDARLIDSHAEDGILYAEVVRPFQTGDNLDVVLYEGIKTKFCYAYNQDMMGVGFHGENFGFGTLKLAANQEDVEFTNDPIYSKKYEKHGNKMSILFLAVMPVAVILARYFRGFSYWFWGHFLLTSIAIYFAFQGLTARYEMNKGEDWAKSYDMRVHSRCGLTIGSLLLCQGLLGIATRLFMYTSKQSYIIMVVRRMHQVIGWTILLVGALGMLKGWSLFDHSKLIYIQVALIILILVFIFLEAAYRMGYYKLKPKKSDPEEKNLLRDPNPHHKVFKKMIKKGKQWSFYDEHLLDLSEFASSHPGGRRMIKKTIGEDMGKYINGSSSLPPMAPFTHPDTIKSLVSSLVIGHVGFANDIFIPLSSESHGCMNWTVHKIRAVCSSTYCVELENSNWRIERPPGVAWMGKHFLVSSDTSYKRYYSLVVCDLDFWRSQAKNKEYTPQKDLLKLYIKPYPLGKVSHYVTQLRPGASLTLKGPMGPGLLISELPNKPCLAFAGGTGILPFLDLAYYVWEGNAPKNFKLYIYISFASNDDVFALDLLVALEMKYPDHLSCFLNIDLEAPNFLTKDGLSQWVDLATVKQAWTCGTSGFNKWVHKMLKELDFDTKSKLIIL